MKISTLYFKEKGVLASLTLTGANPRTSPKSRALPHDYNLRSWKRKPKEVKTQTLVEVKVELKLSNRKEMKESMNLKFYLHGG